MWEPAPERGHQEAVGGVGQLGARVWDPQPGERPQAEDLSLAGHRRRPWRHLAGRGALGERAASPVPVT